MVRSSLDDVLRELDVPELPQASLVLFSGGAKGVDALFDELMAQHAPGDRCIHWSFDAHRNFTARPPGRVDIPDAVAARIADPHLEVAARQLGQSMPRNSAVKALFRRNVFQVLWADEVYVITWEDMDAQYPLRIGGGTKWAAQVYIDRFEPLGSEPAAACKLFFYEVNSGMWKAWNQVHQHWEALVDPPQPLCAPLRFAGIGTQTPPDHAASAVRALFKRINDDSMHDVSSRSLDVNDSEDSMPISTISQNVQKSTKRRWGRASLTQR